MLRDVRQGFRDHEVRRRLDRRGESGPGFELELDRERQLGGERCERALEAPVGEHRRVDSPHELAQLGDRGLGALVRGEDQLPRGLRVLVQLLLRESEVDRERDELRLRAVVQVALDPSQLVRLLLRRGGARLGELVHARPELRSLTGSEACAGKPRLRSREAGADPRSDEEQAEAGPADRERVAPAVDAPVRADDLRLRSVGHGPPPEGRAESPEDDAPDRCRGHREAEPDRRQEHQPAEVLPCLRVARVGGEVRAPPAW